MHDDSGDYYQTLGVSRGAALAEIEAAYARLRADADTDTQHLEQLAYIYEVLTDPQRRAMYDSLLTETAVPPVTLRLQTSRDVLAISDTLQVVYVLGELAAREMAPDAVRQLPLNLCLVVDRSTSMRGERLDTVKTAVRLILDKLGAGDVLSLIAFSDRAQVVLPAGTAAEHEGASERMRAIQASGGTEIYHGLAAGVQQMRQRNLTSFNNQLILLTDGQTYGDAPQCLRLAQEVADEGITITAFGIGEEWNDEFLDELVAPSNGQSGYIEHPAEIVEFLEARVQGLGTVYGRNLQLQQKWPGRVSLQDGFKLTPFAQPLELGDEPIHLGDLEGRAPLTFLLELLLEPQPIPARLRVPLTLTVDVPGEGEQTLQETVSLLVTAVADEKSPPPALVEAVRLLNLYRLNEKAWAEVEAGQLEQAVTRMRHLTTRYLEVGEKALAQQASQQAQRLARQGAFSLEGHKRLKYGTRLLLGKTMQFKDDSLS